jgi:hypothetical protein
MYGNRLPPSGGALMLTASVPGGQIRTAGLNTTNPPKMALHTYSVKSGQPQPAYTTEEDPATRLFRVLRVCFGWPLTSSRQLTLPYAPQATVALAGTRYTTGNWHKSKKMAEHAAAVVAVALARLPVPIDPGILDRPLTVDLPHGTADAAPEPTHGPIVAATS